jgi:hypothetical protein
MQGSHGFSVDKVKFLADDFAEEGETRTRGKAGDIGKLSGSLGSIFEDGGDLGGGVGEVLVEQLLGGLERLPPYQFGVAGEGNDADEPVFVEIGEGGERVGLAAEKEDVQRPENGTPLEQLIHRDASILLK